MNKKNDEQKSPNPASAKKEGLSLFTKKRPFDYVLYASIIIAVVLLDQLTKLLAVRLLKPVGSVPIIDGVLRLTYLENPGAAFGMLADKPWIFNGISIIGITLMLLYLFLGLADGRITEISLAMVAGGGIGNMIDRLSLGYVVDFIDFELIDFYVFNGADSFVCVGGALLGVFLVISLVKEIRAEAAMKKGGKGKSDE